MGFGETDGGRGFVEGERVQKPLGLPGNYEGIPRSTGHDEE